MFARMPILLVTNWLLKASPLTRFRPSMTVPRYGVFTVILCIGLSANAFAQSTTTTRRPTGKKLTLAQVTQAKKSSSPYSAANARARKTSVARSRAAAQAQALRDAQEPRYKLDANGALVPDVRAEAAIIYDSATGHVLWELNSQNQRSIA